MSNKQFIQEEKKKFDKLFKSNENPHGKDIDNIEIQSVGETFEYQSPIKHLADVSSLKIDFSIPNESVRFI